MEKNQEEKVVKRKIISIAFIFILVLTTLSGCGSGGSDDRISNEDAPVVGNLKYDYSMELDYAKNFSVDYYKGGYGLLTLADNSKFLVVPEDMDVPENLEDYIVVLKQPIDNVYMVATAVMSLIVSIDEIDHIRLSGTNEAGWTISEAVDAMRSGDIIYAGKYSRPDYELILAENTSLSVQSTMINHTPEVKDKLEELGIKVLVDQSSSEPHPLGRTEWMKVYGLLFDKEETASQVFNDQKRILDELANIEKTEKTVSFFYINSNGGVVVRNTKDYIAKMIEIAGGDYIFDNLERKDSNASTSTIGMEAFYSTAIDADFMIYNGTIDNTIETLEDLIEKDSLLADFKGVKEGNVWCTNENLYQASSELASVSAEINKILASNGSVDEELKFFYKLN